MLRSKKRIINLGVFLVLGLFLGAFGAQLVPHHMLMDMNDKRDHFVVLKEDMVHDLLGGGMYKCCLEKPCTYCIEKSPGHGDGASCFCLKDVVEGVHPCGECIGEILEGHGNPLLSEYFARAIAEKVGIEHTDTLKKIIEEKYGMPVEDQI